MKTYLCEMCGKQVPLVHDHHIIPWRFSYDDSDSNVMRVCPSCHSKADANFLSLIVYREMTVSSKTNKRVQARYRKKYVSKKVLFHLKLQKYTHYQDRLTYNIKTGVVSISTQWFYHPHPYNDRSIKSRAQLNKAASAKGQTRLGA